MKKEPLILPAMFRDACRLEDNILNMICVACVKYDRCAILDGRIAYESEYDSQEQYMKAFIKNLPVEWKLMANKNSGNCDKYRTYMKNRRINHEK